MKQEKQRSMPTVFNAANELAVSLFLKKKIPYLTITDMTQASMEHHKKIDGPDARPDPG